MINTWNLRDQILLAAHRWHWIVAFILSGALLGWLAGSLWPAPQRATYDLIVNLNAYRAPNDSYAAEIAQEPFRNLDDYKNWQMGQLEGLALSDEFLAETLARLNTQAPAWQNTTTDELRALLALDWRNAGVWHLRAEHADPTRATQAVQTWGQVIVDQVGAAVESARELVAIDAQLSVNAAALSELAQRAALLESLQAAIANWQTRMAARPADQILPTAELWRCLAAASSAADWAPAWQAQIERTPGPGATAAEIGDWLSGVLALIEVELSNLPARQAVLEREYGELAPQYSRAAAGSRALSAGLAVQLLSTDPPALASLRSPASSALIGGVLGLLAWGFGALMQLSRRRPW
jgi:hypothetical protein